VSAEAWTTSVGVLERTQDPDGQFFARTSASIAELEIELANLEAHLQRHLAAAPPERDDNTDLLTQLPHAEVDLNALAGDCLRRFLDAFRVEIHYDVRTRRANLPRGDQRRDGRSAHPTDPPGRKSRARRVPGLSARAKSSWKGMTAPH
jgi:hypothetical protein